MTTAETMTGDGPWRITWERGQVVMIELFPDDEHCIAFGKRDQMGPCGLCSAPIPTMTVENIENDLCDRCRDQVMNGKVT